MWFYLYSAAKQHHRYKNNNPRKHCFITTSASGVYKELIRRQLYDSLQAFYSLVVRFLSKLLAAACTISIQVSRALYIKEVAPEAEKNFRSRKVTFCELTSFILLYVYL